MNKKRNSQIKRLPHKSCTILRRNLRPIHKVLDLHIDPIVLSQLALDRMKRARIGIVHIQRIHLTARVERVETDLATALPLGHVNLGRPAVDPRQPKRRPRPHVGGGLELGREVIPAARGRVDGKRLLGVDRAGEVVDVDGLAPRRGGALPGDGLGGEGDGAVAWQGDVRFVHAGGAVVVGAPGVEVVPVGVEVGLGVKGGGGDNGSLGEGRGGGV